MNTYNENESNRKQAMIPLIALFICFLAIAGVGVGYALNNSTIVIDDNTIDEQYYSIDYTNANGSSKTTVLDVGTGDIKVHTNVAVDENGRTFSASIDGTDTFQRTFFVKLNTDMGNDVPFTVDVSVAPADGSELADIINASACTFKLTDNSDVEVAKNEVVAGVYTVTLTIALNDYTFTDVTSQSELDAKLTALESETFSVTVTAIPTA